MSQLEDSQGRRANSSSLTQPFCCIQAFSELTEAYPHWGGKPAFLSYPFKCSSHPETFSAQLE